MVVNVLEMIHGKFSVQMQIVYLICVLFLGLFLFWRSTRRLHIRETTKTQELTDSRKLFRVGGLFDLVLLCLLFAFFLARILYIVYMPAEFSDARWFWIPYEKIENNIYIMASFPWLFLRLWDGGFLVDGFVLGLTSSFFFFSKFYSLRWSSVADAVADFLWFVFMTVEIFFAVCDESLFHLGVFGVLLVVGGLRLLSNKFKNNKKYSVYTRIVGILWKTAAFLGPSVIVLWLRLSRWNIPGREFLIAVDATGVAIAVWMWIAHALGGFYDRSILHLEKVEKSEDNGHGGELRKKVASETVKARSFAMSYKDFSGGWAEKFHGIRRLFGKKRDSKDESSESEI